MKSIKDRIDTNTSMVSVDPNDVDKLIFAFVYSIMTTAVLVFHLSLSLHYIPMIYQQIETNKTPYEIR